MYFAFFKLVHMIVVQFSMSFVFRLPLTGQPVYYIILGSVCQEVFQNFFKFFSRILSELSASRRQPVYYIILASVCQEVFSTFFKFFDFASANVGLSRTASIVYHTHSRVSIPFCIFLQKSFALNSYLLSFLYLTIPITADTMDSASFIIPPTERKHAL